MQAEKLVQPRAMSSQLLPPFEWIPVSFNTTFPDREHPRKLRQTPACAQPSSSFSI